MRVVYTSDLHVDLGPANAVLLPHIARCARDLEPDLLVVAGDVAERTSDVHAALAAFRDVAAVRVYVPGNHDLYVEDDRVVARGEHSRFKLETALPEAARDAGFHLPVDEPIRCGDWDVVGTPGWWDFSFRDPDLDVVVHRDHYRAGRWRTQRAFDRGRVLWPRTGPAPPPGALPTSLPGDWAGDEEIAAAMLARLDVQMRGLGTRPAIAVVHVRPFAAVAPRGCFGPSSFHDAALGSAALGDRLRLHPAVRVVVTGHLHRRANAWVGRLHVVANPLGRRREMPADPEAAARQALGVLVLP